VLAIANDQYGFAGPVSHHRLKSVVRQPDSDETKQNSTLIILARGDSVFPFSKVKMRRPDRF
jgi:hypothetical protein